MTKEKTSRCCTIFNILIMTCTSPPKKITVLLRHLIGFIAEGKQSIKSFCLSWSPVTFSKRCTVYNDCKSGVLMLVIPNITGIRKE